MHPNAPPVNDIMIASSILSLGRTYTAAAAVAVFDMYAIILLAELRDCIEGVEELVRFYSAAEFILDIL